MIHESPVKRGYWGCPTTGRVILSCIAYTVTNQDGQVIFEEYGGVYGHSSSFAFEKPRDINNTPGTWWVVHMEDTCGRIPASHIVAAYEYCCDVYGKNFEDPITA